MADLAVHQEVNASAVEALDLSNGGFPLEGSCCLVVLKLNENVSSSNTPQEKLNYLNLNLNEESSVAIGDCENDLQERVELMLQKLKVGESCRFNIQVTNNAISCSESFIAVPANDGDFELYLKSFENTTNVTKLSTVQMFERAKHYKQIGNKLFISKNIQFSFKKYSRALKYLIVISDVLHKEHPEFNEEYKTLKGQVYLNMAACQLQFKGFSFVVENCSKALQLEPHNVKALYRRGLAYKQLKEYERSLEDFEKALQIEDSNDAVKKELSKVKSHLHNENSNMAKAMRKMFAT